MDNRIDNTVLNSLGLGQRAPESSPDKLGQGDFLRLMIAQLRNQDPFSPMESGEFLGQLAQFGTVSGIEDVRSALTELSGSMTAGQAVQAASLVDRNVLVPAREAWLPPNANVTGAVDVPPGTTGVSVGVYDLNGRLVARLPVDSAAEGLGEFEWDGSLADGGRAESGYYELRATGTTGGANVALDVLVAGLVESVSVGWANGSVGLTVTGLGVVNFSQVRGIS